ncbi:MAG: hypothetical protein HC861_10230 [Rhodospirillaceae bacterium]|nr:hypothetical protein [Rhodospirillaceae bacterium]
MANITLRPSSAWSETLLHRFDVVLDRLERAARTFFADRRAISPRPPRTPASAAWRRMGAAARR